VTASNAWPDSIVEMEEEVANQVAAPAETRTPNLHRATNAHRECGWKGGDSSCSAKKSFGEQLWIELDPSACRPTFLS
jgi:hypothetical protein